MRVCRILAHSRTRIYINMSKRISICQLCNGGEKYKGYFPSWMIIINTGVHKSTPRNMHISVQWIKKWWYHYIKTKKSCGRHQMETFSALMAICEGNPLVNGRFSSQRTVTRSFDDFFDLRRKKRLWMRLSWCHWNGKMAFKGFTIALGPN